MIEGVPLAQLTAPGLLGITILLLLLGRIVPRSALTDKIAEADKWHQAFLTEREARMISDAQTAELLELAKTTHNIVDAVFGDRENPRQSGEGRVVSTTSQ